MASHELKDFLESGRLKIGLERCNKFLKKQPSDARLLYFKASFLIGLGQIDEGNKIFDQMAQRSPPITDLNLLTDLDELATSSQFDVYPRPLTNGPRAAKLWSNAISSAGKNAVASINYRRFIDAVTEQRWADASTALVSLKKGDPNNRSWKLAHVAVQQLLAEAEKDSRVADMNRMLAFRTLKQTSIDNAGDLRFLIQLYLRQGQIKEARDYFETLKGQDSAVAKQAFNDWQFARQRIELCIQEENWDDLRSLCVELLGEESSEVTNGAPKESLRVRDDWKVWSGLVQACHKLGKLDEYPLYKADGASPWKEKRQQMIATLWVTLLTEQNATGGKNLEDTPFKQTVELVKEYFSTWQTYPFCYNDIKDFVVQLPLPAQAQIKKHSAESPQKLSLIDLSEGGQAQEKKKAEWLTAEVNALKFEYLLDIGIANEPQADIIRAFACNAVRLVEICQRSKQPTAEACYLAVSALIRLYELEKDITTLFQAAFLLETGPAVEDAHPGKVLLVYIESEIGLPSLAIKQYKSLRVREIQYETMSHMLMSRISISHPFVVEQKRQESIDPSRIVDEGLDVFLSSDQKLAKSQIKLFEQGKCDLIFELQDLRSTLAHSMSRRMLILEQARIARLTDDVPEPRIFDIRPRVPEHWIQNVKDSRDYAETFCYDGASNTQYPERRLQAGGKIPKSKWLATAILAEDVWSLLCNRDTVCVEPSGPVSTDSTGEDEELTPMETELIAPWNALLQATKSLLSIEKPNASLQQDVKALETALSALPTATLSSYKPAPAGLPPSTAHLQSHYLILDFLRSSALFAATALHISNKKRSGSPLPSAQVTALKDLVRKHHDTVRKSASDVLKNRLDARDIVQAMRRGVVGDAVSEAPGLDKAIRGFADRAEGSAREAWEGVLRVKVAGV